MTSKNGEPVLVSLLQYMKNTTLNNPDIVVKDERITELDQIVTEVKQSEEWEAVKVSLLSVGIGIGKEEGRRQGITEGLANSILTILKSKGTLTEQMISKVKKEEDQAVLNSWLLKASQAPDPETFWKEIIEETATVGLVKKNRKTTLSVSCKNKF